MSVVCDDLLPPANNGSALPVARPNRRVLGTNIDFQLSNAVDKDPVPTRIAVRQPVDTNLDTRATRAVLQTVDPLAIDLGHFDARRYNVAYRIYP
jgi:hypothetical protein